MSVLAIDPGREKFGWAVVAESSAVLAMGVDATSDFSRRIEALLIAHRPQAIVIGDRTGSKALAAKLEASTSLPLHRVDEHNTTLVARRRYFAANPPRGLRRLLPTTLQTPPRAYDDYVALILAERFLTTVSCRDDL